MNKIFNNIKGLPFNLLLFVLSAIFIFQVAMVMFYSNNVITFSNKYSYYSINRAADFADANFTSMKFDINFNKEINGFLYPFLVSFFYKITGKNNIVPLLYVLIFIIFLIISIIFYIVSERFLSKEISIFATMFFVTSMPVIISIYSGTDVILTFLLIALNIYFLIFDVERKQYKGALITSFLLFLCSFTAMIFGFISIIYVIFKFFQKSIKRNYSKSLAIVFAIFLVICSIFFYYVFAEKQDIQKTPFFETKTFFVDTFLKDGFLWSKLFASFVGLFFYIGIFIKVFSDIKNREITFNIYSLFLTIAVLLVEFFSTFSRETETLFFISPFSFVFILYTSYGLYYFSLIFIREKGINKNILFWGLFLFIIFFNIILVFNKTVEQNNNIRFIANEFYIQKFMEK